MVSYWSCVVWPGSDACVASVDEPANVCTAEALHKSVRLKALVGAVLFVGWANDFVVGNCCCLSWPRSQRNGWPGVLPVLGLVFPAFDMPWALVLSVFLLHGPGGWPEGLPRLAPGIVARILPRTWLT